MQATLQIHSTDAKIGLSSSRPPMRIKQEQAGLDIKQKHVGMIEISKTASKLYIDQTEAFADANLKSPIRMANEFWQKSMGEALNYFAKKTVEGRQLMKIENGGGAITQIAKQNSERPLVKADIAYMPRSMSQVKFSYEPSKISLKAPYDEPNITVTRRPPQIDIPKWQTEAYIKQKNSIHFEAVGTNVNRIH